MFQIAGNPLAQALRLAQVIRQKRPKNSNRFSSDESRKVFGRPPAASVSRSARFSTSRPSSLVIAEWASSTAWIQNPQLYHHTQYGFSPDEHSDPLFHPSIHSQGKTSGRGTSIACPPPLVVSSLGFLGPGGSHPRGRTRLDEDHLANPHETAIACG